ncbi:3'-5' exonuclease [Rhizobium sp. LEGMi198b]
MDSQLDMFTPGNSKGDALQVRRRASRRQMTYHQSADEMIRALEGSGEYRILRKLPQRDIATVPRAGFQNVGIVLDTETTGLDHRTCEIIELGLIAFTFDEEGKIGDLIGTYGGLQQPTAPIPPEVTRLTGITDEMVDGKIIDMRAVKDLVVPADLIIAHNAGFDRPFYEAFSPVFANKAWACSVSEIDWSARGFEGTKLGYLIGQAGYFHTGHRAVDDCFALLEVLDRGEGEGAAPFAELFRSSRRSRARIYAEHSPFDMKDVLKARGYRWSDGSDGRPKSWWIEVAEDGVEDELCYLRSEIYRWDEADPPIQRLTAFDRFKG